MTEETTTALAQAGELVLEWLRATGDLVIEQAPILAQEVLAYGTFEATVWFVVSVVFTVAGLGMITYCISKAIQKPYDDYGIGVVLFILITTLPFAFAVGNYLTLKKIELAPKLYLLQEIGRFVK